MVCMVEVTEIVVVVVVAVMVLVRMVVVMVMVVMVRGIVGWVHFRVGRRISGHHGGRGRFKHRGRSHGDGTHFDAARTGGRRHALVAHGFRTVHVGHLVVSAVRTPYALQVTEI